MVLVSCLRIRVVGEPEEKMTSGLVATISFAKALKRIHIRSTPAVVDMEVAALDPAKLLQTLMECRDPALDLGIVLRVRDQRGDPPRALLRAAETGQGQRPRRRAVI
jgi:hypothetical protein